MSLWYGYAVVSSVLADIDTVVYDRDVASTISKAANDPQPAKRWHTRLSLDKRKYLIEAVFDLDETKKHEEIELFEPGKSITLSRKAALDFIAADLKTWEPDEKINVL